MAGHRSIRSHTSHHSSHGESHGHGSHGEFMLREMQAKDKALDLRIRMVKKAAAAAKAFARELQALGIPKDEAGRIAIAVFDIGPTEEGHGGH